MHVPKKTTNTRFAESSWRGSSGIFGFDKEKIMTLILLSYIVVIFLYRITACPPRRKHFGCDKFTKPFLRHHKWDIVTPQARDVRLHTQH